MNMDGLNGGAEPAQNYAEPSPAVQSAPSQDDDVDDDTTEDTDTSTDALEDEIADIECALDDEEILEDAPMDLADLQDVRLGMAAEGLGMDDLIDILDEDITDDYTE